MYLARPLATLFSVAFTFLYSDLSLHGSSSALSSLARVTSLSLGTSPGPDTDTLSSWVLETLCSSLGSRAFSVPFLGDAGGAGRRKAGGRLRFEMPVPVGGVGRKGRGGPVELPLGVRGGSGAGVDVRYLDLGTGVLAYGKDVDTCPAPTVLGSIVGMGFCGLDDRDRVERTDAFKLVGHDSTSVTADTNMDLEGTSFCQLLVSSLNSTQH
jgi:hypothetical protein